MASEIFSLDNPVFANFAFYALIVAVKMMAISWMTVATRLRKMVFANPEDVKWSYPGNDPDKMKPFYADPDVERVRRMHLNDLENIPVFLFVGLVYVASQPAHLVALWHFRVFVCARFLHTFFYTVGIQPVRGISFATGFIVTISIAVQVMMKVLL